MDYEQIAAKLNEFNAKNVQTLMSLTEKSIDRSQKLAEVSFDTTKSILVDANDTLSKVLNAKDPQAVLAIAQESGIDGFTSKLAAHQQSVSKIVREAAEEVAELSEASMEQMKSSLKDWVESVSANAPAGSDAFVSALKTSIDTTLQGVGQVQAAAKEVISNVEKTTDQAVEAIKGQVANVKKAATKTAARPAAKKAA
jgi:hypothetical protein